MKLECAGTYWVWNFRSHKKMLWKTKKNILWKFIMNKEKSKNGPPNLFIYGKKVRAPIGLKDVNLFDKKRFREKSHKITRKTPRLLCFTNPCT